MRYFSCEEAVESEKLMAAVFSKTFPARRTFTVITIALTTFFCCLYSTQRVVLIKRFKQKKKKP